MGRQQQSRFPLLLHSVNISFISEIKNGMMICKLLDDAVTDQYVSAYESFPFGQLLSFRENFNITTDRYVLY